MVICRHAEGVHGQRKVGKLWSSPRSQHRHHPSS